MGQITITGGVRISQGLVSVGLTGGPPLPQGYTLWTWGLNVFGRLGDGTSTNRSSPVQIGSLTDWTKVSGNVALKNDSSLWVWGRNTNGSVGDGTTIERSSPVQIGALTDWASINNGQYVSHAIKTDGSLWGWGDGGQARIGDGTTDSRSSPVQIGALTDWAKLGTRGSAPHAIKTDGSLWGWGAYGRVGDGTTIARSSPVQIGALTDWALTASGNNGHSFAIKTDGSLWAWGENYWGNLGLGDTSDRLSPVQVGNLTDWASVDAAHGGHTNALKTDGSIWGWGRNSFGEVGDGTIILRSSPVQIGNLTDWTRVNASMGPSTSSAIKNDGTIWVWGNNNLGQLGQGNVILRSSPVQVGALTDWVDISGGMNHSAALKTIT